MKVENKTKSKESVITNLKFRKIKSEIQIIQTQLKTLYEELGP